MLACMPAAKQFRKSTFAKQLLLVSKALRKELPLFGIASLQTLSERRANSCHAAGEAVSADQDGPSSSHDRTSRFEPINECPSEQVRHDITVLAGRLLEQSGVLVNARERQQMVPALADEIFGLGPLETTHARCQHQ